jgi:hypothetical protein
MKSEQQDEATNRLTEIYAEVQSIRAGPSADQTAIRRRSLLYTEMLDLQRSLLPQAKANPAPEQASLHDKMYLHLADEQITDAEALLAFRRRLQATFYPDYADTLSVQVLLADLSEIRRNYLQDWMDREETTGHFLSVDKEWLDYRLAHANVHCQRVHAELRSAEEERLSRFSKIESGSRPR